MRAHFIMDDAATLLEHCRVLAADGQKFETVWSNLLSPRELSERRFVRPASGRCLLVPLRSGQMLEFDEAASAWELRGAISERLRSL